MSFHSKHIFFFCLSFLFLQTAIAQIESVEESPPKIEKLPEFRGGEEALLRFIYTNIKYPYLARENNISGLVVVSFVIMEDGSVQGLEVKKAIGGGCDEEAMRVMELTNGKWTPGSQDGVPVRVAYNMPIRFMIEESNDLGSFFRKLFSR